MLSKLFKCLHNRNNKIIVQPISIDHGNSGFALIQLKGNIRARLIDNFKRSFIDGDGTIKGGKTSPSSILPIIVAGAAATGASGYASGQLFMTTAANPSALMPIGVGFGSAVVTELGKIVKQAPFIPLDSIVNPVTAPLLAFQVISAISIARELSDINRRIGEIIRDIARVMARAEATIVGEVISAENRLRDIEKQYAVTNQFTDDMRIRLAVIEDTVNSITERYHILFSSNAISDSATKEDADSKLSDAYMAIITAQLDMRIDALRLKLLTQDNPRYLDIYNDRFIEKIAYYDRLLQSIKEAKEHIERLPKEMQAYVDTMHRWNYHMPSILGGKREERRQKEKTIEELRLAANKEELDNSINNAVKISSSIKRNLDTNISLVYWKDETGEHSYYIEDFDLLSEIKQAEK